MPIFFSSSCVLCGVSTKEAISLCIDCQEDLPKIESACSKCGIPLAKEVDICGECLRKPSLVDYNLSLYLYKPPIDFFITQLKFKQQLSYARILGYSMQKFLKEKLNKHDYPEVILPVPLHKNRIIQRGFNQSLEISRSVSASLGIPVDYKLARRVKSTRSQMGLPAAERKRNIKGCFQVRAMPAYEHVVLVDDVVTTGSTTNELALMLKEAGVKRVGVWSIARVKE